MRFVRLLPVLPVAGALLVTSVPTAAVDDVLHPGTVRVASRVFLVGEVPRESEDIPDFLPLTEVEWVNAVVDADPLLGPQGTVLHVRKLPSPPAYLFGEEGIPHLYQSYDAVPEVLRFDGLDVRTSATAPNPQHFVYRPDNSLPDFLLTCSDPDLATGVFDYCEVLATYPLDPVITLKARFYRPTPIAELAPQMPAVAARMREIAFCLDVTVAPPAASEAALEALLVANPTLSGCEDKLSS